MTKPIGDPEEPDERPQQCAHDAAQSSPDGPCVIEEGCCVPSPVSADFGISVRTVYGWLARYRAEGSAGLADRPSTVRRPVHKLPDPWVELILRLRRNHRLTALEIAERLHMARSTVSAILARDGLGRLRLLEPPAPVRRYEGAALSFRSVRRTAAGDPEASAFLYAS